MAHKRGKQPQGFYVPDFAWGSGATVGTNASGGFSHPLFNFPVNGLMH